MTTILDALQKGTGYFEKYGVESARLNMQCLLAKVLDCDRMTLYVDFDRPMDETALENLRALMKERVSGRPLQHLLGNVEFYGREFHCDERALIPRPETEHLVELLLKKEWPEDVEILDVGCGSGVIGLTIAAELRGKRASVTLVDVSSEALALARENAGKLADDLEAERLSWVESDLFASVEGEYDLIVANLPYVSDADMEEVSREVKFDPELALRGGADGMEVMARFLRESPCFLKTEGQVAMEFGLDQGEKLVQLAGQSGFSRAKTVKDDTGRPRYLFAQI